MPRRPARSRFLAVAVGVVVALLAAPAFASELGTPSDHSLVFPVEGPHHFSDTFWAIRSHGAHSAQDIFADKGTPVVAAADGVVGLVNWSAHDVDPERCCSVVIDHNDGWQSTYIHLDNDTPGTDDGAGWGIADGIAPGTAVTAGQLIGWVGDSGNAEDTPAHLHFELRDPDGVLVNSYPALVAAGGNATDDGPADPAFEGGYATRLGDEGFHVRRLQSVLGELGYQVTADGDFGPVTQAAVLAFQEGAGLDADGLFGRASKTALADAYEAVAVPTTTPTISATLRRGSRGAEVVVLQQELNEIGHSPGVVDGIFGPMTERAVVGYQIDEALIVDGIVGPQTLRALGLIPM